MPLGRWQPDISSAADHDVDLVILLALRLLNLVLVLLGQRRAPAVPAASLSGLHLVGSSQSSTWLRWSPLLVLVGARLPPLLNLLDLLNVAQEVLLATLFDVVDRLHGGIGRGRLLLILLLASHLFSCRRFLLKRSLTRWR